jgi:hypothetical protein
VAIHPATRWLEDHWHELREFDNHWIAVNLHGVIMRDESFDGVIESLRVNDISFADVVLAFITFDVVQ